MRSQVKKKPAQVRWTDLIRTDSDLTWNQIKFSGDGEGQPWMLSRLRFIYQPNSVGSFSLKVSAETDSNSFIVEAALSAPATPL